MNRELEQAREQAGHLLGLRARREGAWQELSRWICPWRGEFSGEVADAYDRERVKRFTGAASAACLRSASGMTSGMTPRNVSWFKPTFPDGEMLEASGARAWLDAFDLRIKDCLSDGGFYQAIQNFNLDLIWAGCALLYSQRTERTPLAFECPQVGSWAVGLTQEGLPGSVARVVRMGAADIAAAFGADKLGDDFQRRAELSPYEQMNVYHLTRPAKSGRYAFESLWWLEGRADDFLRRGGYYEMPFFFARWHEGATPYGSGPGDQCLADARQMDFLERYKLGLMGKLADPPIGASPGLKDALDLSPGGINYLADGEQVRQLLDLTPAAAAIRQIQEEIASVSQRLSQGLMASIFDTLPLDQRPADMSATEFLERKREGLQQLGPVISAYEPNVLTPLLYRAAATLDRAGLAPPIPQSLRQIPRLAMKIDFISPMANALRQNSVETARAIFSCVGEVAQVSQNPQIFDKLDLDQLIDELATGLGAPGAIIRSDEDVQAIRQNRAQQQLAAQQQQQVEILRELAKEQAKSGEDNKFSGDNFF